MCGQLTRVVDFLLGCVRLKRWKNFGGIGTTFQSQGIYGSCIIYLVTDERLFSEILFDGQCRRKFVNRTVESFSVFKSGIKPEWEDPANATGGEWFIRKRLPSPVVDATWDKLIMGLVGETIDPEDEITGARIVRKVRTTHIIEKWR